MVKQRMVFQVYGPHWKVTQESRGWCCTKWRVKCRMPYGVAMSTCIWISLKTIWHAWWLATTMKSQPRFLLRGPWSNLETMGFRNEKETRFKFIIRIYNKFISCRNTFWCIRRREKRGQGEDISLITQSAQIAAMQQLIFTVARPFVGWRSNHGDYLWCVKVCTLNGHHGELLAVSLLCSGSSLSLDVYLLQIRVYITRKRSFT